MDYLLCIHFYFIVIVVSLLFIASMMNIIQTRLAILDQKLHKMELDTAQFVNRLDTIKAQFDTMTGVKND